MRIVITGASGFMGRRLTPDLVAAGSTVQALGRTPAGATAGFTGWDALRTPAPAALLDGADAVVHLIGEPVAQRWNAEVKRRIYDSRVTGTRNLVAGIAGAARRPRLLISVSAIGYYGDTGEQAVTESAPPGRGFLASTCVDWEREATAAESFGVSVVRLRVGIVLGRGGGALPEMVRPFRMGAGGRLGTGKQWMSWIHIDDLVGIVRFLLGGSITGAVNATSPNPVRNSELTHELGAVLHRPAALAVPRFALKLIVGEMADSMLESQRVLPGVLTAAGFPFRYPELRPALENLLLD